MVVRGRRGGIPAPDRPHRPVERASAAVAACSRAAAMMPVDDRQRQVRDRRSSAPSRSGPAAQGDRGSVRGRPMTGRPHSIVTRVSDNARTRKNVERSDRRIAGELAGLQMFLGISGQIRRNGCRSEASALGGRFNPGPAATTDHQAAPSRFSDRPAPSASEIAQAALTKPMWLNACGKLPSSSRCWGRPPRPAARHR